MQLTRRGVAAVCVAIVAVGMGWAFGSRSLNAIAVTALIAIGVGAVQLRLAGPPSVERSNPRAGFPGDQRAVSLQVTGSRGTLVHVTDTLPDGLTATDTDTTGVIPVETPYQLGLTCRGHYQIGPATVRVRDPFGLLSETYERGDETSLLVYPTLHDVASSTALTEIIDRARTPERQEIDHLREYVPGDPLRDIAWKASAKRLPEFVVTEYAGQETAGTVEIAVSGTDSTIDETASAAASVAVFLLEAGLEVGLTLPGDRLQPSRGPRHRERVLATLAQVDSGAVPETAWTQADVQIAGKQRGVRVGFEGHSVSYGQVRGKALSGTPLGNRHSQAAQREVTTT
ncbi:DUF58 domain-containing protein [Halorhabdus sp. CBA1104]|uniref:DUF58 domain-containing protein n=1 Tax=Halorhabdus sp. CBA1104 TaxID=1380432 RepID=UPI0012B41CC0|nr:DUF58 domain-containing protein [Halorhabdus sp. CBA1104]QGN05969.1 DUF58 domain-containing protein [Halorhabdus sp. CBA1104]